MKKIERDDMKNIERDDYESLMEYLDALQLLIEQIKSQIKGVN